MGGRLAGCKQNRFGTRGEFAQNVHMERRPKATNEPEFAAARGNRAPADLSQSISDNLPNVEFSVGKDVL